MIYKRKSHKGKIFVGALVIAAVFGTYAYFQSDKVQAQSSNLEVKTPAVTGANGVDGPGLISIVDKIESIKLDGSLFSDPVFVQLQDRTVTLPVPVVGRANPFASVGNAPVSSKTTSGSN